MFYRTCDENKQLLASLEELHKTFKVSLGGKTKSRKWAIWLLQGASLGLAYRATKYQEGQEDLLAIILLVRLSSEFLNQVTYFADPNTKFEAIDKWWKKPFFFSNSGSAKLHDIKYSSYKKNAYTHKHPKARPEGIDFSIGEFHKETNDLLSLWAHPSLILTEQLFETDGNRGPFYKKYEFRQLLHHHESADFYAHLVVENAAKALHLGSYLFGPVITLDSMTNEQQRRSNAS